MTVFTISLSGNQAPFTMHDDEPDTFVYMTWPGKVVAMLREIDIDAQAHDVGSNPVEKIDYYNRYMSSTPRMVTNRGSLSLKGSNIDIIQIIQKG